MVGEIHLKASNFTEPRIPMPKGLGSVKITNEGDGEDSLVEDPSLGGLRTGKLKNIPLPKSIGEFTLYFNDNSMEDIWLALTWYKAETDEPEM